ncbi:MAG: hypothetical protein WC371_05565 [Parachlamydiales bacterium]|jgi:hypothetical protein
MLLKDVELCFNRAVHYTFSKKKFWIIFPVLILCGILIVFCRALSVGSISWMALSTVFLPIFLCAGVLLAVGTLLCRIYYHEVKSLKFHIHEIFSKSLDLIIGTAYLSFPPILIYLLLWALEGIFLLLKEIPSVGPYMGVFLAVAPFLITLSSILLVIFSLALLFYATPVIAFHEKEKFFVFKRIREITRENVFRSALLFLLAVIPLSLVLLLLILAAYLTNLHYVLGPGLLVVTVKWFFIMIPFCFFLSYAVIFFFNFASESYNLLRKN